MLAGYSSYWRVDQLLSVQHIQSLVPEAIPCAFGVWIRRLSVQARNRLLCVEPYDLLSLVEAFLVQIELLDLIH